MNEARTDPSPGRRRSRYMLLAAGLVLVLAFCVAFLVFHPVVNNDCPRGGPCDGSLVPQLSAPQVGVVVGGVALSFGLAVAAAIQRVE